MHDEKDILASKPDVKGHKKVLSPDGVTVIYVQPPRGPGPWWRVKHPHYGGGLYKAKDRDAAIKAWAEEKSPGEAQSKEWLAAISIQVRTAKLEE